MAVSQLHLTESAGGRTQLIREVVQLSRPVEIDPNWGAGKSRCRLVGGGQVYALQNQSGGLEKEMQRYVQQATPTDTEDKYPLFG